MVRKNCPYCNHDVEIIIEGKYTHISDYLLKIELRKIEPQQTNAKEIPKRDVL